MILDIIIEGAYDKVTSVKYHYIERDQKVYDHGQGVNAPGLREHIHVVVPFLSERQHRQDHVSHQEIQAQ